MNSLVAVAPLLAVALSVCACDSASRSLPEVLMRSRSDLFGAVLDNAERNEIQIIYTQIDRDERNRPQFVEHRYRVDPARYFYPASSVKLAGALVALEKLNLLGIEELNRDTALRIDSAYAGQSVVANDSTSETGFASIGHYIKKIFLVSDNDAYNRLYEFVGQRALNESLREKGYHDVRLTHRLSILLTPEENRRTNPFAFFSGERTIYAQPAAVSETDFAADEPIPKGVAHIRGDSLIPEPMDFAAKNYMSLEVLHGLLRGVVFPESVPEDRRFQLSGDDYVFLYRCMGMTPRESRFPSYDPETFPDSYAKYFMFGDSGDPMPESIRVFNKVGAAYGYLIDNAYVVDFERGIEFLLSAVISVNENRTFNDGVYEYDATGIPFLANLGRVVYEYERNRTRRFRPDLSRFDLAFAE
jgi:hypothetical protein